MELTIDQALRQGVTAHKAGKLKEAERHYRTVLQSQPAHPDVNHNLGLIAVSVNKVDAALPLFKRALETDPKKEQFWLSYLDALIQVQQLERAELVFEQAKEQGVAEEKLNALKDIARLGPSQEQLRGLLEHYQSGNLADAEKFATLLTEEFPAHQFGWKVLGAVLKQTGRLSEALTSMRRCVQLAPQDAEAHSNEGSVLQELNRLEQAETSYRLALTLKADFAEGHYNLGNTLRELNRLNEAETSYRQAIALKADFAEAHYNLGITLVSIGRIAEAETCYKQAIVFKEDFSEAHYNLGTVLQELDRFEEAEASYKQAIALKPDHAEAHSNLGVTLKKLGRLGEAEANFTLALTFNPDFAEARSNLGNALQELGRLDEAEANLRQAITLKPDFADPYCNLGITLEELGRLDEAAASYKQAVALKPDYAEAFWNLHSCVNTVKDAEHWIDQCLIADTNNVRAKLTKAALKFYQGDRDDFEELKQSELKQHPFMRSFSWAFSLDNLPELHFNKWCFFDAVIKKSIISRPFYEFGVWRASSFKYLNKAFKKGYGFDTFTGLPEDWVVGNTVEKKGFYSSGGNVPKIEGGEFIVGRFEDTLPNFFSETRPLASVINFDADLYSSTICALNYSKSVIDKNTVLVFDEFIINESWEQDEFKALNEFCSNNQCTYEVVDLSFFTKQVAVKLIDI